MYQQKDKTTHLLYSQEQSPEDNTLIDNPVYTGDDAGQRLYFYVIQKSDTAGQWTRTTVYLVTAARYLWIQAFRSADNVRCKPLMIKRCASVGAEEWMRFESLFSIFSFKYMNTSNFLNLILKLFQSFRYYVLCFHKIDNIPDEGS